MDEVQGEDGEEVAGGAVGGARLIFAARLAAAARISAVRARPRARSEPARPSASKRTRRASARFVAARASCPCGAADGRALAVVGAFIFDADDDDDEKAGVIPVSCLVTARTPSATSGTLISRETRRPDVRCAFTDGVAEGNPTAAVLRRAGQTGGRRGVGVTST